MTLILQGISKRFGRFQALNEVSLHVESGSCYGFLGHNGAGKTTAMRIALGLSRPDAGRVLVDGFDAARHRREALARMGGLIEAPAFYPWLNGRHNLQLLAGLDGLPPRTAAREAYRLLELVGLASDAHRKVGGYSQGMRQRLGIAQALLGSPSIILLDEPISGLDPEGIEEVRRLITHLTRDQGLTVLLSSHQLAEVSGICSHIGILRKGRLLVEAPRDQILSNQSPRYSLLTDRPETEAAAWCTENHLTPQTVPGTRLLLDLGECDPQAVARDLMNDGFGILAFAPAPPSLEEIYLTYTQSADEPDTHTTHTEKVSPADTVTTTENPTPRIAPAFPTLRAWRAESRLLLSRIGIWFALLMPAAFGLLAILRLRLIQNQNLAELHAGELISATAITAFEAIGVFLQAALPAAGFICAGLASQALAGEFARGTLQQLALRPITRTQLALGKALGMLTAAMVAFIATLAIGWAAAGAAFEFTDVVEIMEIKGAVPFVIAEAAELRPALARMLPPLALALAAYTALGFLAGALTTKNGLAIGLSAGMIAMLDLGRELLRNAPGEHFLLSAYHPSLLRDTSPVAHLLQLIRAPNDPVLGFPDSQFWVPLLWILGTLLLSALIFQRRSIR